MFSGIPKRFRRFRSIGFALRNLLIRDNHNVNTVLNRPVDKVGAGAYNPGGWRLHLSALAGASIELQPIAYSWPG